MKKAQWCGKRHAFEQFRLKQIQQQWVHYIATDLHIDMEISEMEMLVRDTTIKARGLTPDMLGVRP